MEFKSALVFDRISEELKIYCAGHNIDDVYNTKFLEISPHVLNETRKSIERLSNGSVHIINLVIPKPDIPLDIAENYKQVIFHFAFKHQTLDLDLIPSPSPSVEIQINSGKVYLR